VWLVPRFAVLELHDESCGLRRLQHVAHQTQFEEALDAAPAFVVRVGVRRRVNQPLIVAFEALQTNEVERVLARVAAALDGHEDVDLGILAIAHPVDVGDLGAQEREVAAPVAVEVETQCFRAVGGLERRRRRLSGPGQPGESEQ